MKYRYHLKVAKRLTGTAFIISFLMLANYPIDSIYNKARHPQRSYYANCGPRALLIICKKRGIHATLAELCTKASTNERGTTLAGLTVAATAIGFKAVGVTMDYEAVESLNKPAVAWVDGNHYVAVLSIAGSKVCIHDPNKPREEMVTIKNLLKRSRGVFLLLT